MANVNATPDVAQMMAMMAMMQQQLAKLEAEKAAMVAAAKSGKADNLVPGNHPFGFSCDGIEPPPEDNPESPFRRFRVAKPVIALRLPETGKDSKGKELTFGPELLMIPAGEHKWTPVSMRKCTDSIVGASGGASSSRLPPGYDWRTQSQIGILWHMISLSILPDCRLWIGDKEYSAGDTVGFCKDVTEELEYWFQGLETSKAPGGRRERFKRR